MLTIKADKETLDAIREDYKNFIIQENVGYILFAANDGTNIITAYKNKKGIQFKVTFQGDNYLALANKYSKTEIILPKKEKIIKDSPFFIDVDYQIGSDEVGVGDFLGPIVVCAAYVDHETMKLIYEYGIKDSKKFGDDKIMKVIPLLLKKVFYEHIVFTNERYNNAVNKGYNMVQIKAILHNSVLTKLKNRFPVVQNVYIDQFTSEANYFAALKNIEHVTDGVVFKEKGETYFPSVALASCIARYYLLAEFDFMSKKYNMKFPRGAGEDVDKFSLAFIEKYGRETFDLISKHNWENYKKVTDLPLL